MIICTRCYKFFKNDKDFRTKKICWGGNTHTLRNIDEWLHSVKFGGSVEPERLVKVFSRYEPHFSTYGKKHIEKNQRLAIIAYKKCK